MALADWFVLIVGVVLQCMVVSAMLRGPFKRYPFVFAYLVFSVLSTVVQFSSHYYFGGGSREFKTIYWTADLLATFLILMIIFHLIRTAMEGHPSRNAVYVGLLVGAVSVAAVSVALSRSHGRAFTLGKWMTMMSRDYYFSAVLLTAILWFMLMRTNNQNKQLYLITSGLGLLLSGAAIAHALRVTNTMVFLANWFLVCTYLLNLYIWYTAFKKFSSEPVPAGEEVGSPALPR